VRASALPADAQLAALEPAEDEPTVADRELAELGRQVVDGEVERDVLVGVADHRLADVAGRARTPLGARRSSCSPTIWPAACRDGLFVALVRTAEQPQSHSANATSRHRRRWRGAACSSS
jgi:hypothetical protein